MVENKNEAEQVEHPEAAEVVEPEPEIEPVKEESNFDKLYSNIASNRYENLRTSHIEQKAKELRKRTK
ncbi:hypothetical protein BBI08_14285 [Planococcus halocryophilus]|uniref:Uncharacterized protein n=2 Tax=Planococcus halocryophilus TaxID=1215089 RepID=A0A1C7DUJ6_9BACL|nr:hypothetical protein [Planococcus halocryophilus]ANU14951.1 hypothetical protein BBI08_14285 [Planococcus halocryophilus]